MSEGLTSALSSLNPFARKGSPSQDEAGEEIDNTTIAGGGHSARRTEVTRHQLRASHALKSFLLTQGELTPEDLEDDAPETPSQKLMALLDKPHINVPPAVLDRSHPLPEYFISSSHNTYLLAHQLYGTSSATAYQNTLKAGARCVEIDAWDDDAEQDEPKVTHGYTLVSHISFRSVCETIRDIVDQEAAQAEEAQGSRPAPILISLENHCDARGQKRLVDIMKEVWGDRLLSKAIREKGHEEQQGGEHVTLEDLGSKIVLIVEFHLSGEGDSPDTSSSSSSSEDEEEKEARRVYKEKKKGTASGVIIPELAELGVYAQSIKPIDNSWFEDAQMNEPHHHLINVSETGLLGLMPAASQKIAVHNAHHLMRVFPKGIRISSKNMKPVPFWGLGAHICALNWQSFGLPLQLNEALFAGTDGFVLKPASLRAGGDGAITTGQKKRLRLHVAGATDVPLPQGRDVDDIKPYVTASLFHPSDAHEPDKDGRSKQRTAAYKHHKLGFLHHGENPPRTEPIWDDVLEWEYEDNELVFLRILIKSEDAFAVNPILALTTVRILYAAEGWSFIRMLDLKGRETKCSLLVKFQVLNAD